MPSRSSQLLQRSSKSSSRAISRRSPWSPREDLELKRFVAMYGTRDWIHIAGLLNVKLGSDRIAKQCRERYLNHLVTDFNKSKFTEEESEKLFQLVEIHGTRWTELAKYFPDRAQNQLKNYYHSRIRGKRTTNKTIKNSPNNSDSDFVLNSDTLEESTEEYPTESQSQENILSNFPINPLETPHGIIPTVNTMFDYSSDCNLENPHYSILFRDKADIVNITEIKSGKGSYSYHHSFPIKKPHMRPAKTVAFKPPQKNLSKFDILVNLAVSEYYRELCRN